MNFLDNLFSRRPTSRKPESRKEGARVFGKQITNLIHDKPKPNHSLDQKPLAKIEKVEKIDNTRNRSKSFVPCEPKQHQKDVVFEYEAEITNQIFKDNNCIKPIKCSTITLRMRAILLDWMVDVHHKFQLKDETLFLSIRILDEYMSVTEQISKKTLQLVGITCLWIASKYEQIYPPRMKNYVTITDNTYTQNEIHETQAKILNALNFQVLRTTPLQYLSLIIGNQLQSKMGCFCRYLLQLSSFQFISSQFKPIVLILASLQMSQRLLKHQPLAKRFRQKFGVEQDEINKCFKQLCKLLNGSSWQQLSAIKRKYSKSKYHEVGRVRLQKS